MMIRTVTNIFCQHMRTLLVLD